MKAFKGYISGLKWSGIMEFLFETANSQKLELKIIQDDKGILRRTIYFQVAGEDTQINEFRSDVEEAVREHNGDAGEGEPILPPKDTIRLEKQLKESLEKMEEILKKHPSPPETGSDFGKGLVYCLALFCCHFENDMANRIRNIHFLMEKTPEERDKIINKTDPEHTYGKDIDEAIFYWQHILPIQKTPEKMLSREIALWANGASDHLYDLTVPEKWKGSAIDKNVRVLKDVGLQMGHGFLDDKTWVFKDFTDLKVLTGDIAKLIDKELGVEVINARWGEL